MCREDRADEEAFRGASIASYIASIAEEDMNISEVSRMCSEHVRCSSDQIQGCAALVVACCCKFLLVFAILAAMVFAWAAPLKQIHVDMPTMSRTRTLPSHWSVVTTFPHYTHNLAFMYGKTTSRHFFVSLVVYLPLADTTLPPPGV